MKQPNASFVIIGNEILSGRTQDVNLNCLAKALSDVGVKLKEVRVVSDVEEEIVKAVNELRTENDYVFTSGGIGPTHDDITSESIGKAFGVKVLLNDDAIAAMEKYYPQPGDLNDSRKKMAMIPVGAGLIKNEVSAAPGFIMENVYVMAGVPSIFKAMVDEVKGGLKGGAPMLSVSVRTHLTEGSVAKALGEIQKNNPGVEIGSYPFMRRGDLGVSLVTRGQDQGAIDKAVNEIRTMIVGSGGECFEDN